MKRNLKQSSESFTELKNLINKSINVLELDNKYLDIEQFNLKPEIVRRGTGIFIPLENYNAIISKFITKFNILVDAAYFQQDVLLLDGKEVVCLTDLKEKYYDTPFDSKIDDTHDISNNSPKINQFGRTIVKKKLNPYHEKGQFEYSNQKENFINYSNSEGEQETNENDLRNHSEITNLDGENESMRSERSRAFLNKKPFFNKHEEQEEWNVQMIDSIISKITQAETPSTAYSPITTPKKRKKQSKPNELSIRPFVCEFKGCNSAFKRFEHLKRHNRIHTGERPFKCTFPGCYKKFARSDNLSQHIKIHNMKNRHFSEQQLPFYRNKF